jgi:hypothetical protein
MRKCVEICDLRQGVGAKFKCAYSSSIPDGVIREATQPMLEIADLEKVAWEHLREIAV